MLRRALIVWGLGHITLGDRRGFVLLLAQPFALAVGFTVTAQLIDGTRWLAAFPLLGGIAVIWLAQAVHAQRLAVQRGARRGGELQVMWLVAGVVFVLTAYWLIGGRYGSPSSTLGAYLEAWIADRPEMAAGLHAVPRGPEEVAADWRAHAEQIRADIATAAMTYGTNAGLELEQPFNSLRFSEVTAPGQQPDTATMAVDLVRLQRVESSLLGFIPTASQQTVIVRRELTVRLVLVPQTGFEWLPAGMLGSLAWRVAEVDPT